VSAAYLTGSRDSAEQKQRPTADLPGFVVHRCALGHHAGARLDDYHHAQPRRSRIPF
jgi:hypothetical protein